MNGLEIGIIIGLAVFLGNGFRRGLIRSVAAILSLAVSLVLVSLILPYVTDFLKEKTPVYERITEHCQETVGAQIDEQLKKMSASPVPVLSSSLDQKEQNELIEKLQLPVFLKKKLVSGNQEENYRSLHASTFQDYLIQALSTAILNVISFLAAVILIQVVLRLVLEMLDLLSHLPGISFLNRVAGGAFGLLEGMVVLWLFFLVLSMLSATNPGRLLLGMIQESPILSFLYEKNLFLNVILRF